MDRAAFRLQYPEANTVDDTMLDAYLSRAATSIAPEVFGARYDEAHGCLTAHLLALSPYGKAARLVSDKGKSTYGTRYDEIRLDVTCGLGRII